MYVCFAFLFSTSLQPSNPLLEPGAQRVSVLQRVDDVEVHSAHALRRPGPLAHGRPVLEASQQQALAWVEQLGRLDEVLMPVVFQGHVVKKERERRERKKRKRKKRTKEPSRLRVLGSQGCTQEQARRSHPE